MRNREGFTLIELMIVVAIIAIIAAIAIPSILRARISGNQTSAIGSLETIVDMNATFRQNDDDRNGTNDYWVGDVWGLHGLQNAAGDPIEAISRTVAQSDYTEGNVGAYPGTLSADAFPGAGATSKAGYFLGAYVDIVDTGGNTTNYDGDGDMRNANRFGFMAFPAVYDNTGINAYHVSESGDIYRRDAAETAGPDSAAFNNSSTGDPTTAVGTLPIDSKPLDPEDQDWNAAE